MMMMFSSHQGGKTCWECPSLATSSHAKGNECPFAFVTMELVVSLAKARVISWRLPIRGNTLYLLNIDSWSSIASYIRTTYIKQ